MRANQLGARPSRSRKRGWQHALRSTGWRQLAILYAVIVTLVTLLPSPATLGPDQPIDTGYVPMLAYGGACALAILLMIAAWRRGLDRPPKLSWPAGLGGVLYVIGLSVLLLGGLRKMVLDVVAPGGPEWLLSVAHDLDSHQTIAYFTLAIVAAIAWRDVASFRTIGLVLLGYGAVLQLVEGYVPGREFEWMSLIANGLGVVLGLIGVHLVELGLGWTRGRATSRGRRRRAAAPTVEQPEAWALAAEGGQPYARKPAREGWADAPPSAQGVSPSPTRQTFSRLRQAQDDVASGRSRDGRGARASDSDRQWEADTGFQAVVAPRPRRQPEDAAYPAIESYGLIGDMHSAALVGIDGSIDWLCLPHFDSPSVFAAILDARKGGRFRVGPRDPSARRKQFYWPETNVLVTRFFTEDSAAELVDFMPVGTSQRERHKPHQVFRRLSAIRGKVEFRVECRPAFNYGRDGHRPEPQPSGIRFLSARLKLELATRVPLTIANGAAVADLTLDQGESALFVLSEVTNPDAPCRCPTDREAERLLRATLDYWRRWLGKSRYRGRWRQAVERSALTLKLLTFEPTGAMVAAPTCSLPQANRGEPNQDYRHVWIRDNALAIQAFLRLGLVEEAGRCLAFLASLCTEGPADGVLRAIHGISGDRAPDLETLDHLEGHRGSGPVLIGRAAERLQLDVYGEIVDAAYRFDQHGAPISYDLWLALRRLLDWVCDYWERPDQGIWEMSGKPQHFVHSKLMCWVALDRGLRLADARSFPADQELWQSTRDAIYEDIMAKGWKPEREAFVQAYDGGTLDAANLAVSLTGFTAANDPRMLDTLDAIMRSPPRGGLLAGSRVYRCDPGRTADGRPGEEATFNVCAFWLIEALTRVGRFDRGRLEDARSMLEEVQGRVNHLGLYAEAGGPDGEPLGAFPQAYTHLAQVLAAVNLDAALGAD